MQRKRGELVPIGEVVSGLDDVLVPAIRDDSPQAARHSFTVADQVHQLVSASEADPDRGFMARMMALCSLPRPAVFSGVWACDNGMSQNYSLFTAGQGR